MNIDELIRDSIDESTAGGVPAPDLAAIRRAGRRRSAVRTGAAAIATLGVVTAGTVAATTIVGSDEPAQASAPAGHSAAYLTDTSDAFVLNWGGHAFESEHARAAQMPAMTEAGLVYLGDDGTPYLIDRSGDETKLGVPVGDHDGWADVASDTIGDHAAWARYSGGTTTISRFDAATGDVTTSEPFDCADVVPGCDYASVQAVSEGTVYVTAYVGTGAGTIAWDPSRPAGERLYPVTDPGTSVAAAGPGQLVLKGTGDAYGGPGRAPLPPSTEVTRLGRDESREALSAPTSADGQWRILDPHRFVMPEPDATHPIPVALNVVTGRTVALDVPDVDDVTFDADGSLLVIVKTDGGQRMDDCAIPSGTCTTVIEDLAGGSAVFADGGVK